MLLVIKPLTFIPVTVGKVINALPLLLVLDPLAKILGSRGPPELAEALLAVILPFALVAIAIIVLKLPSPIPFVFFKVALVSVATVVFF